MKSRAPAVKALLVWLVVSAVLAGCNLPTGEAPAENGMEQTQISLGIQATMLAEQQATLDAEVSQAAVPPPVQEQPTQPVLPVEQPTYTPYPTYTVEAPPLPADTAAAPAAPVVQDVGAQVKAANILVFEDMQGMAEVTYVRNTVNRMGFRGGKIVFVGDAVGNFMEHLNSPQPWDLIIVAAESRSAVRGEFWDVILERVNNRDAALIVEIWYLDSIANGRIAPLLYKCGVEFERDWTRSGNYDPYDYSIYWLDSGHPLLSSPNYAQPLSYPTVYWTGDVGDLIRLGSSGDAELVGGLYMHEKSSRGVLATCLDGTMVIQTFCSHDYPQAKVQALWENYITYTLTNHFKKLNAQ
jgi:hypothetical protein